MKVAAPAALTLAAAKDQDLMAVAPIRVMFKARELVFGSAPAQDALPRGLVAQVTALGWGLLANLPNEIVLGAVTRPWEANVVFHSLPPGEFAGFTEPDYVKIAWTLRVDPDGSDGSIFRTETRAVATDPIARARFRRYWALVSPGVRLIRRWSLQPLRRASELRARHAPAR